MKVKNYLDKNQLIKLLENIENNIISPEIAKEVLEMEANNDDLNCITNIITYYPTIDYKKQYSKNIELILRYTLDNYNKYGNKVMMLAAKMNCAYFLSDEKVKKLLNIEKYDEDTISMKIDLMRNERVWENKKLLTAYFNLFENAEDDDYAKPHWYDELRNNFMVGLLNRVDSDDDIINYINKYSSINNEKKVIVKNLLERRGITQNSESFNKLYKIIDNLSVDELDTMFWLNGTMKNSDIDSAFSKRIMEIKDDELMTKGIDLIKKTEVIGYFDEEQSYYVLGKEHDKKYSSLEFSDFNIACLLLENSAFSWEFDEVELLLSKMNVYVRGAIVYITNEIGDDYLNSDIVASFISTGDDTDLLVKKVRALQADIDMKTNQEKVRNQVSDDILDKVGKANSKRDFNKILNKIRKNN